MREWLRNMWWDESGQTVPEYALMLAVLAAVVVGAVIAIGTNSNSVFDYIQSRITTP